MTKLALIALLVATSAHAERDVRIYARTTGDLDGDGTIERAAAGFSTSAGRRRATVFVERRVGETWQPIVDGGWLGGGGGGGSAIRAVEIADLDGNGTLEIVALGSVGSQAKHASARLVVLELRDGALHERAKVEWNDATYTHGTAIKLDDLDGDRRPEIITIGVTFDGAIERGFKQTWSFDQTLKVADRTPRSRP